MSSNGDNAERGLKLKAFILVSEIIAQNASSTTFRALAQGRR